MDGVLRAEPVWVETFTGLPMGHFEELLRVVRERGGSGPGGGRPWCLPLGERVLLVAVCSRCGSSHHSWAAHLPPSAGSSNALGPCLRWSRRPGRYRAPTGYGSWTAPRSRSVTGRSQPPLATTDSRLTCRSASMLTLAWWWPRPGRHPATRRAGRP